MDKGRCWRTSSYFLLSSILLCLWIAPGTVEGQFPRVCADNATKEDSMCCPTPPGTNSPCGGPGRGLCLPFDRIYERYWPPLPSHLKDDRLNWPYIFYKKACACIENYSGYMCQDCKWGYHGEKCAKRRIQERRNIHSLTKKEQKRFITLIDRSKYEMSEYVALKTPDMDPIRNPVWINITIHNFIVWIHFYSARNTYYNRTSPCEFTPFHMDFSHEGAGFPTFHRLLMLTWEREIQKLAKDDTFMFPYWDWTSDGQNCTVCTNDIMGASNKSGHIDPAHPLSKWKTVCHLIRFKQCRYCDPSIGAGPIIRRPGNNHGVHELPSEEEVDDALANPNYDVPPYDENAGKSFRSCFEGSCPRKGLYMGMHGLVHAFLNGSMSDVATSTNDPIFILHHSFLDKLFELWLRRHRPHETQFPARGAPIGHNRDAIMVPFFPRHFHRWYSSDSRGMGYTYDDFNYGKSGKRKIGEDLEYFVDPTRIHTRNPWGNIDDDDEYDRLRGGGTLMAATIVTPLIIFAFLAALVLHDRLKPSDVRITRVVQSNGKSPNYTMVSDNETTEDEEVVFCEKSQSCVMGQEQCLIPPEKKPLMDEYHD